MGYLSFLWLTGLCELIYEISSDIEFPVELWSAITWTYVTVGGDLNGASGNRTSSVFMEAVLMISLCSWDWLLSLAHSGPSRPTWGGSHYGWGRGGMVKTHIPSWLLVDKMTTEARFSLVFTHLLSLLIFILSSLYSSLYLLEDILIQGTAGSLGYFSQTEDKQSDRTSLNRWRIRKGWQRELQT